MDRRFFLTMAGMCAGVAGGLIPARQAKAQIAGSTLVWGSSMSPSLDPHAQLDNPSSFTRTNLYDSLFIYDGVNASPTPWLVEAFEKSEHGLDYQFVLRPGVKFHNGNNLTAADAVYSLKRVINLGRHLRSIYSKIYDPENVVQTGELSFNIKLNSPYAAFLNSLTLLSIVNQKLVEENSKNDLGLEWLSGNDAGSGAYSVIQGTYRAQESLDLARFPDHFAPGTIERVLLRPVKDDSTRLLALMKGDIDATTPYLRTEQIARLETSKDVQVVRSTPRRVFMVNMNNKRKPFDNRNFRKALASAFPYEQYNSQVKKNEVLRINGPIPPSLVGEGWKAENSPEYDLDRAKEYLEKAKAEGIQLDRPLEFLAAIGFDETLTVGQIMQSELKKLGIDVTVSKVAYADFVRRAQTEETTPDFWSIWVDAYFTDPESYLAPYTVAAHGTTIGAAWYNDQDTERMIREARELNDASARQDAYRGLSARLLDQSPSIWVYIGGYVRGVRARVQGWQADAIGDAVRVSKLTVSD